MQWIAVLCAFSLLASSRATVYVNDDDDTEENVDVDVWYGPGFYYGYWFNNEDDYRDWHDHHHGDGHFHDGGHHDGGHHHDGGGHRGGGGHGGGGHGK